MSGKLVTVAAVPTSFEARILMNFLESEGIRAVIADGNVTDAAWQWGVATGGAKVQVKEEDYPRALALLEDRDRANQSADIAPRDEGEESDTEAQLDRLDRPRNRQTDRKHSVHTDSEADDSEEDESDVDDEDRYEEDEAAGKDDGQEEDDEEDERDANEIDVGDTIDRAYRSAILGCVFAPFFFYSLFLLLVVFLMWQPITKSHKRKLFIALACDLIGIPVCMLFLWMILRH